MRATRQSPPALFEPRYLYSPAAFTAPIHFRRYDMADPKKQEKDYTKEVDAVIPEAQSLVQVRRAAHALAMPSF